jgi:hypothetical protein
MSPVETLFDPWERFVSNNCVFFAADEFLRTNCGYELNRADFDSFLEKKVSNGWENGVFLPNVPFILDEILNPYGFQVNTIWFKTGKINHFRSQMKPDKLDLFNSWNKLLADPRVVENDLWPFPFVATLASEGVHHVHYFGNLSEYYRVMFKIDCDPGAMGIGYRIGPK